VVEPSGIVVVPPVLPTVPPAPLSGGPASPHDAAIVPEQVPAPSQLSLIVQTLPSLQVVPTSAGAYTHAPPVHVPAA
jgi:hypothetical protein